MGTLRIVSHSEEAFRDRVAAGQLLAKELAGWRGQRVVVLGIPRGGLVVACELARAIDADLDIVLSRKLRTPGHEELAMGAVSEDGKVFLNDEVVTEMGISRNSSYLRREQEIQMQEIARRAELIRRVRPKVPIEGRVAIVTDDGVATGATMQAAVWAARQEHPSRLVVALPVGPEDTVSRLAQDADEVMCLRVPPYFAAVGQFYLRFGQVEDEEVLAILKEEYRRSQGK
jgi:predicted phosphoribosyltransferase